MKLNKIAINKQHIPPEYVIEDGFLKDDVSAMLVFIQGNKKQQKEKCDKIKQYCKHLREVIL